jgi:RHS repeat-associated protein
MQGGFIYDSDSELAHFACKFTGKERDTESGLDYSGARYYTSSMGRFMSPDWSANASPVPYANLENPQTLNLYSYMNNNPSSNIDVGDAL